MLLENKVHNDANNCKRMFNLPKPFDLQKLVYLYRTGNVVIPVKMKYEHAKLTVLSTQNLFTYFLWTLLPLTDWNAIK